MAEKPSTFSANSTNVVTGTVRDPNVSGFFCDALSFADVVRCGKTQEPKGPSRFKLDWWKLYLDSCATYYSVFVAFLLDNVTGVDTILRQNCNSGVTISTQKGCFGLFHMWLI